MFVGEVPSRVLRKIRRNHQNFKIGRLAFGFQIILNVPFAPLSRKKVKTYENLFETIAKLINIMYDFRDRHARGLRARFTMKLPGVPQVIIKIMLEASVNVTEVLLVPIRMEAH